MPGTQTASLKRGYTDFLSAAAGLYDLKAIMAFIVPWLLFMGSFFVISLVSGDGGINYFQLLSFSLLAFIIGWSAAGGVLMDRVCGNNRKSLKYALIAGVLDALRILAALILTFLVFLLWLAIVALVLYVCKIPVLGPLLYAIASPVLVIGSGVALFGFFSFIVLVPPAVWKTHNIIEALTRFLLIVRTRLPQVFVQVPQLLTMTVILIVVLSLFILAGQIMVNSISLPILGSSIGWMQMGLSFFTQESPSAYNTAGLVGSMLLVALGLIAPINVSLTAASLLYVDLSEGLNLREAEESLSKGLETARSAAGMVQSRVVEGAQKIREHTEEFVRQHSVNETPQGASRCPKCGADVLPGDVFCGNCGVRVVVEENPESGPDPDTKK